MNMVDCSVCHRQFLSLRPGRAVVHVNDFQHEWEPDHTDGSAT